MDLESFLALYGTTEAEISKTITTSLALAPGDILLFSGSLIEGLGNAASDVDVYAITASDQVDDLGTRDMTLECGGFVVDVELISRQKLEEILRPFLIWSSKQHDAKMALRIPEREMDLLHRFRIGRAITNHTELTELQQRISTDRLARFKLDWAINNVTRKQLDLAGLRSDGDWKSMLFAAQELLGYVIDCLLAAYGYTNPGRKWRARLLDQMPNSWAGELLGRRVGASAGDHYMVLHQAPTSLNAGSVYEHALRIVAFSRQVLPWSDWALDHDSPEEMPGLKSTILQDSEGLSVMPNLDLDVQFRYREHQFLVYRLAQDSPKLEVSPEILSVLSLFDGQTPKNLSETLLRQWFGNRGRRTLEDVYSLLEKLQLTARPFTDPNAVRTVIEQAQVGART